MHPQLYRQDSEQVMKPSNDNAVTISTTKLQNTLNSEKRDNNKEDSHQPPSNQSSGSSETSNIFVMFYLYVLLFSWRSLL